VGTGEPFPVGEVKWLGLEVDHSAKVKRMSGDMHLLPLYAFMVWTGTTSLHTNGTEMLMCFILALCF